MAREFVGTDTQWDALVADAGGGFSQSSLWFLVCRARHHPCVRVLDDAGAPSLWVALRIVRGMWVWFCPKGPAQLPMTGEWDAIIKILQRHKHASVVRIEPHTQPPDFFSPRKDVSPSCTLITTLQHADEELFASFHEKTRYNIRVSERASVEVRQLGDAEIAARTPEILALYHETSSRHDIGRVPQHELESLFPYAQVWGAFVGDRVVATSVHVRFGDTVTYVHGASRYEDRASMGPYALHWTVMRAARDAGATKYDWWGVAPEGAGEAHPLAGVTRFKIRFGGARELSFGTFDMPVDRLRYALYTVAARLRKK